MTCIIGLIDNGDVYLGADSLMTVGWDVIPRGVPKITRRDNLLIGGAGTARNSQLLRHKLVIPLHDRDDDDETYICVKLTDAIRDCLRESGAMQTKDGVEHTSGTQFIIGYKGGLYKVGVDYCTMPVQAEFYAIGCGGDFAIGALDILAQAKKPLKPPERIEAALAVAAKWSAGVREPFQVEKL